MGGLNEGGNLMGEILLGGKCPFVRTKNCPDKKKLSGQKNYSDKKIVRTKKLSGQKNCPNKKIVRTKKLSGQKNCPDKKMVRTKKWSGQKIVHIFV